MRKIVWIIIVAVIAVGAWVWFSQRSVIEEPTTEGLPQLPEVSDKDTTTQIQQDLNQIDLGDIEKQFESIDADLNNL